MRVDARSAAAGRVPAWWTVAWVLVLAGLFGMHGLGDHGVSAADHSHADPAAMVMADAGMHAVDPVGAAEDHGMPVPGHHDATAICLAVLVAALLTWTLARRMGGPGPASWRPPRAVPSRRTARERDPPSLIRLSILRC